MVAAVWLGQAIGTLLPSPLTAPMLAVVGFVGLAVSPMIVAQDSRDPGTFLLFPYLQGPRDGGFALQMLSARANLSQALWFAALAATAPAGLEPATSRLEGSCSIRLSYGGRASGRDAGASVGSAPMTRPSTVGGDRHPDV